MKVYILNETRVNNFSPNSLDDIMELWNKCFDESDEFINYTKYAIYYDYASDYRGDYTLAIATEEIVTDKEFNIDMPKFIKYSVGDREDLANLWEEIWDDEENNKIIRNYKYDYERHNLDGSIDIFINIK